MTTQYYVIFGTIVLIALSVLAWRRYENREKIRDKKKNPYTYPRLILSLLFIWLVGGFLIGLLLVDIIGNKWVSLIILCLLGTYTVIFLDNRKEFIKQQNKLKRVDKI